MSAGRSDIRKGPFIIYAWGWAGKNKEGGGGVTPISGQSEGGHEKIGVREGGGLSNFTILFYFKEMSSLLSAVLNGTRSP